MTNLEQLSENFDTSIEEIFDRWTNKEINQAEAIKLLEDARKTYDENVSINLRNQEVLSFYELRHSMIELNQVYFGP